MVTVSPDRIKSRLRRLRKLPVKVDDWLVETGEDHSGWDAVFVWVILHDQDTSGDDREVVGERVREAVKKLAGSPEPWVYVRFRGVWEDYRN